MEMAPSFETVIFVDVGGVLNVGVKDGKQGPLMLNETNCRYAEHYAAEVASRSGDHAERGAFEKVLSVMAKKDSPESTDNTFAELACKGQEHIAAPLLRRLAEIIVGARQQGPTQVVLASNWRRPKYVPRVRCLEQELSKLLGERFVFDARTRQLEENTAADRLRCIGDFLVSRCAAAVGAGGGRLLRAIVLDDLFITPLDGWLCGEVAGSPRRVRSEADMEAYLRSRVPATASVAVKVIHPYSEWNTESGLRVQVGSGLTQQHVQQALTFLTTMIVRAPPSPCRERGGRAALELLRRSPRKAAEEPAKQVDLPEPATKVDLPEVCVNKVSAQPRRVEIGEALLVEKPWDMVAGETSASLVGFRFKKCLWAAVPWMWMHM